ncbi:MAG: protease inhibitor I9 family protein [candidate division KSB1 bacterium]|nr:protease inhibitor I9 family protein [candidate division KSB1 bacterium]
MIEIIIVLSTSLKAKDYARLSPEQILAKHRQLQQSVVKKIRRLGGTIGEQFWVFNGLSARLTAESIPKVARHKDVRLVELAQTDIPPP